jgi:AcrR family transcriptional regulator
VVGRSSETRTRGYRKKERTRAQLIEAGLRILAEKGQGMTVSDVAAEAGVSSGTFYNYFADRDEFTEVLAEHYMMSLAAAAAEEPIEDPARRFATATVRVLRRAQDDRIWASAMLRLLSRPDYEVDLSRYLREDLDSGLAAGRFDVGSEDAVLDQVSGLIFMTVRRIVEGRAAADAPRRAVEVGLRSLGIPASEAADIASEAERENAPGSGRPLERSA